MSRQPKRASAKLTIAANASLLLSGRLSILLEELSKCRQTASAKRVHDLRVASRRLRECLGAFQRMVGGSGYKKPLRLARELTRMPGDMRNLDVAIAMLRKMKKEVPDTPAGRGAGSYLRRLVKQQKGARKKLEDDLKQFDAERLERKTARLLKGFEAQAKEMFSEEAVRMALRDQLDTIALIGPRALDHQDVKAQHGLRIAFKRLRYRLETLSFLFSPKCAELVARVRGLQDLLGAMHDLVVLLQSTCNWMEEADLSSKQAADAHALVKHLVAEGDHAHRQFAGEFRRMRFGRMVEELFLDLKV